MVAGCLSGAIRNGGTNLVGRKKNKDATEERSSINKEVEGMAEVVAVPKLVLGNDDLRVKHDKPREDEQPKQQLSLQPNAPTHTVHAVR